MNEFLCQYCYKHRPIGSLAYVRSGRKTCTACDEKRKAAEVVAKARRAELVKAAA